MLQQFLKIVNNGSVQSQFEIAGKMGISPGMVLQIARELTAHGYLQGSEDEACTSNHTCSGCPMGSTCQTGFTTWALTEKGAKRAAVEKDLAGRE
jgi:hypothetical protein